MPEYNDDDGKITIIAGKNRHWRTVSSTTVTFAARLETVLYFYNLNMLPHPENDYYNALSMYRLGASIVSPISGMVSHVEKFDDYRSYRTAFDDSSEYVSLYFDWVGFGQFLVNFIKSELSVSLWSMLMYDDVAV
jgi:hypothetical protein